MRGTFFYFHFPWVRTRFLPAARPLPLAPFPKGGAHTHSHTHTPSPSRAPRPTNYCFGIFLRENRQRRNFSFVRRRRDLNLIQPFLPPPRAESESSNVGHFSTPSSQRRWNHPETSSIVSDLSVLLNN